VKVSIITVCYNAQDYIENAIISILTQDYEDIEYIIVDGKSTDRTMDIVYKYKDHITRIISEKDQGIYDAMNKGIKAASGDLIYFLNADDRLYDSQVVSDVVRQLGKRQDVSLLYGNVVYVYNEGEKNAIKRFAKINRCTIIHEDLCHQSVFAKRSLFEMIGLFDLQYKICADYDWLLKAFLKSKSPFLYFNRIIAYFHYGGMHAQFEKEQERERLKVKLKYWPSWKYYTLNFVYRGWRKIKKILKLY
jgi:glycosyltransferase involved in cell wall biosynthesis